LVTGVQTCALPISIKGRSSGDVLSILGYTGRTEMIHRDDLVLRGE